MKILVSVSILSVLTATCAFISRETSKVSDRHQVEGSACQIEKPGPTIFVTGCLQNKGRFYAFKEGMTVQDVIELSGGFCTDAIAYRAKVRRKTGDEFSMISLTLEECGDFLIHDGDHVFIEEAYVTIFGAVFNGGLFSLSEAMTLGELIEISGGLALNAIPDQIRVTRETDEGPRIFVVRIEDHDDFELSPADFVYVPWKLLYQGPGDSPLQDPRYSLTSLPAEKQEDKWTKSANKAIAVGNSTLLGSRWSSRSATRALLFKLAQSRVDLR